jgi:hypothetical protein
MSLPIAAYSEGANHRAAIRASAGRLCAGAVWLFTVLVVLLHFIEPEFGPTWRFVSEYSNGRYGWVMRLAFFVMAFGCGAAVAALRPHVQTRPGRVGLIFLALTVIGLVMAGLFNQDPITTNAATTDGQLHALATMIGIPGFTVASLILGMSLARRWTSARTPLLVLSQLPWIAFVSMPVYMAVVMPTAGGFGPTVWVGLLNRVFLVAMCSWLLLVAWHAERARS